VDIDKEGLTKLNIPATSKYGGIPVLTRYQSNKLFESEVDVDINDVQLGTSALVDYEDVSGLEGGFNGITVEDENLKLSGITYNMIYHNVIATTSRVLANAYSTKLSGTSFTKKTAVSSSVSIGEQGGHSLTANLDGSFEMSVGADTIDKKSMVLDTAGAVINRIGRDKQGRSVMTQADGDVMMQVGGVGVRDEGGEDPRFTTETFRAGSFILQIVTSNSNNAIRQRISPPGLSNAPTTVPMDQVIRVTEDGVEIFANKLVFDITGDIEMCSGSQINIRAPNIFVQPGHVRQGKGLPPKPIAPNTIPIANILPT
jgi:hypothetical protein